MEKIGIIVAMREELEEVKKIATEIVEKKIYELTFLEAKIENRECVIVECGIGKVNAARTTQILIDNYKIKYLINVGVAGSANDELNIGDIVIGENLVQHDFDLTAFGYKKGYISNVGENIKADKELLDKIKNIINEKENKQYKIVIGTIASGDIFCTSTVMKEKIRTKFIADAIEMESASIAQVCYLDKIPFIIIRSISDNPNNDNKITYEKYLELAAKRSAQMVLTIINKF